MDSSGNPYDYNHHLIEELMRRMNVVILLFASMLLSLPSLSQTSYHAKGASAPFELGGGIDTWYADYSQKWVSGPTAWATVEIWRGLGITAEGHSLIWGGSDIDYKYFSGEGGLSYANHHWRRFAPYGKAEVGFGGLSVRRSSAYRSHDTRTVWSIGGGAEYQAVGNVWAKVGYTYEFFPDFLSFITYQKHVLNPNGVTIGISYHFR